MIEYLDAIDKSLLLYLNGMHTAFFDQFMWWTSKTATWSLMALVLLYILVKKGKYQALFVVVGIALVITLADQISSGIIKDAVERLRPTHDAEIGSMVHTVNGYRGGRFGFVSSHAANTMGVAMFISLLFGDRRIAFSMFFWSCLVAYSRIYLGVHYPGDILGGTCVGLVCGLCVYKLYKYAVKRWNFIEKKEFSPFTKKNGKIMMCGIWGNLLITVGVSMFICFLA